jgi:hypothetical protein
MSLYPEQDHMALGDYYLRHVDAMTGEGLHAKSDIAAQLAWRDREIDRLRASQPQQPAPAEPEHVSHSLGGFRAGFESLHGRPPTEQEIWNAAIRSWRDLNPAAAVQPPVLPLTEEEIDSAWEASGDAWLEQPYAQPSRENLFARAIEAKVRGTGFAPPLTDALIDAALALHVGWNAKEPEHRIAERIDLLRRLAVGYLVKTVGVSGTGSVPPSANLDVHPAQRSTQGARTEGAD